MATDDYRSRKAARNNSSRRPTGKVGSRFNLLDSNAEQTHRLGAMLAVPDAFAPVGKGYMPVRLIPSYTLPRAGVLHGSRLDPAASPVLSRHWPPAQESAQRNANWPYVAAGICKIPMQQISLIQRLEQRAFITVLRQQHRPGRQPQISDRVDRHRTRVRREGEQARLAPQEARVGGVFFGGVRSWPLGGQQTGKNALLDTAG